MVNQIKPKHSVEALATIRKLKYFGHILRTSDSTEKIFVLRLTCSSIKVDEIRVTLMINRREIITTD